MIRVVVETASTNDDVLADARDGAPEGLWLRADRQTAGRGRQGRAWQSPPGNLYASTLVRLQAGDPAAATLALVAAVALQDVTARLAPAAVIRIKWPNDLLADGAKLAGILLEREGDAVVIGFGVNLAHHPDDIDRCAINLAVLGASCTPGMAVELLAECFARWLARWRNEGLAPIRTAWLAAAHPIGTALSTAEGDGLFDGLEADGALRLCLADGSVRVMHAGDVFLI
ncbi:biotin--[acetyl-CoA-carboxylase] ligase [Allosphingosinicella indica]|uniref:BirA family transcriptional regulator, biotin operon repressor / biotin-[acetyl-CoA-carboxylase] ligase n=1 Tax=Allosphingosinicella indica TaxID=941907 RepID=A0A1X7GXY3_9SPHN|nr:biotin--[acetyl-CoA-carboxylase] ligase [Allosphingosinicella indica]SMF75670.1 BirA family transcriptional regulator, biotin operon repressor / biotin-[acetyl-CoA-carboxylase] ligase [Allosphingosinicella indica]